MRFLPWFDDLRRDVPHAARLLRRNPLFALTAALSLAIGMGATTTAFTVVNAILFRPPAGLVDSSRLVDIGTTRMQRGFGPSSYPSYLDIRRRVTTLDTIYAYSRFPQPMTLGGIANDGGIQNVYGSVVTTNYFQALGAVPSAGRLFGAVDGEQPWTSPVVVVSHRFWLDRTGKDPAIVGRMVTLNGHQFTIVGVASEGFHGTGVRALDVWVPMTMAPAVASNGITALSDRSASWLMIGARLKPGVSVSQAAAEVDVIGRTLQRDNAEQNRDRGLRLTAWSPIPGSAGPIVAFVVLLTAIVSCVLMVACANVAGVLLARAAARRREMAVRLAIGAGRGRVVRQVLTETMVLFLLGGVAGVIFARAAVAVLIARLPTLPFPVDMSLSLDSRVMAFAAGLSLIAALVSGLAPALLASNANVLPALKNNAELAGRLRLRHAFVVAQVAVSLVVIICSGLFMRALQRAASIDPGFDSRGVELASIDLVQARYTNSTGPDFARLLADRVRELPEAQSSAIASGVPGGFEVWRQSLRVPGATGPDGGAFTVDWTVTSPGYFATLRTPLLAGRDFATTDGNNTEPVAIVSETAARQFWPGQDPIGRLLLQPADGSHDSTDSMKHLRVIGVARDLQTTSLMDGQGRSAVYVPLTQRYVSRLTIVARAYGERRITDRLRTLIASMDRNVSITEAQTLEDSVALGLVPQRVLASVSGSLGIVGLILAGVGVYGVTAYAVIRRTREIGIRIAIGARRADVVRMVLREGMYLTVIGSTVGLALAAAVSRILAAFLFGIPPLDPLTFTATTALFIAVGLAACYLPVRRATHIQPTQALRYE